MRDRPLMPKKLSERFRKKIAKKIKKRAKGIARPSPNEVRDDSGENAGFNKQNLLRLFESEINARVRWSESESCIKLRGSEGKWAKAKGFVEQIRHAFYPLYDYKQAKTSTLGSAPGCEAAPARLPGPDPALVRKIPVRRNAGLSIGTRVDDQLTEAVNTGRVTSGALEPYTASMLAARQQWGWQPLVSQFPIVFPEVRVGTRIDEIATDDALRLILIENKTGYTNYLDKARGMMRGPLSDVSDAPLNQHFLQLGLALICLERHWGVAVHAGFVVQVDEAGVVPHPLPAWFHQRKQAIGDYFIDSLLRA